MRRHAGVLFRLRDPPGVHARGGIDRAFPPMQGECPFSSAGGSAVPAFSTSLRIETSTIQQIHFSP
jgi:hypothetical protein